MDNYNFLQKYLHIIFLKNSFFNKSMYEIEKILFLKSCEKITKNKHIFISGLPRSGTTILLNFLYNSNCFSSLTYSDMPFLLGVNIFSKYNSKHLKIDIPRVHNDGILYNIRSPEAFDEVFFSSFKTIELEDEFENYVSLIIRKYKRNRYLSKNNLNYSRIKLITSIFPYCNFVIPFRDPIQHAMSLKSQHLRFLSLQKENPFILKYMNLIYHNEFGLNHKPWNKPKNYDDPQKIEYWLEQWLFFYQSIYSNQKQNTSVIFFCFEKIKTASYIHKFENIIMLPNNSTFHFSINKRNIPKYIDKNLVKKCYETYDNLKKIDLENL